MSKYIMAFVIAVAGLAGAYAKACGAKDASTLLPSNGYASLLPSSSNQPRTEIQSQNPGSAR